MKVVEIHEGSTVKYAVILDTHEQAVAAMQSVSDMPKLNATETIMEMQDMIELKKFLRDIISSLIKNKDSSNKAIEHNLSRRKKVLSLAPESLKHHGELRKFIRKQIEIVRGESHD